MCEKSKEEEAAADLLLLDCNESEYEQRRSRRRSVRVASRCQVSQCLSLRECKELFKELFGLTVLFSLRWLKSAAARRPCSFFYLLFIRLLQRLHRRLSPLQPSRTQLKGHLGQKGKTSPHSSPALCPRCSPIRL